MAPEPSLRSLLDEAILILRVGGLRLSGSRELPNGIQATFLSPEGAACRFNFYFSDRKGFSAIPAGGDPATSRKAAEILGGSRVSGGEGSRIGSDEAGKGDYMGPLTVAAVFADPSAAADLRAMGAVDSKKLSDSRIRKLAEEIRRVHSHGSFHVVTVPPEEYNRRMESLRARGRNSLHLLADCHAEAVGALLAEGLDPDLVVIDRFCPLSRMEPLLPPGRYTLRMPVGGESDPVVAAASILARDAYLEGLDAIAARWKVRPMAGAGTPTDQVAESFVTLYGPGVLTFVAKLHFRNTFKILGPEP
jgi:ribonuclease HIII